MKFRQFFLFITCLLGALFAEGESLIVTNGETLEMGGTYTFDNVLISDGTVYLTNDTVITSSGDISILTNGTITWHYTTTNWSTNVSIANPPGRYGGYGTSVIAQNGSNAWNLALYSDETLTINGVIDLRGGAGQTHIGRAGMGSYGGSGYFTASQRAEYKGGNGGNSQGGNGGLGGILELQAGQNLINLQNSSLILSGGSGGNGGTGGTGGPGGDWSWPSGPSSGGQGADGGDGGDSLGGNGGAGGRFVIRTVELLTDNWSCATSGGANGLGGQRGDKGPPGLGQWTDGYKGGFWPGSEGERGNSYNGISGTNGVMDVIKQAEPRPGFENGQFSLGLDMTSTSATYIVECCTNLLSADWQTVGTFNGRSGGTNWVEALSNRFDKAFYRIQTVY